MAYPDAIRAVGSVAGLAYGETSADVARPRPFTDPAGPPATAVALDFFRGHGL